MEMENNKTLINIPEFTAEQYYSTSEPYEYLYQFRDDKFALRQMCERMKQQAGALGKVIHGIGERLSGKQSKEKWVNIG